MASVKKGYSLTHAYKAFKEKHGNLVTLTEYRKICVEFNKRIVSNALTGRVVKLPYGIGDFWIKKIQTDWEKPRLDLNETKIQGKKVYHLNEHSDGWWARWYWTKNHRIPNMKLYSFQPTRGNSRAVAKIMKQPEGHKRFFS